MHKRLKTGIDGLDKILDGGFLYHNSILIKGEPGAGKTTLGMQIVYNGAVQLNEPGIIVLFEQFPQQLMRDISSYNWKVEELVKEKKLAIIFAQAEEVIANQQVSESPLISRIQDASAEIGARRIVIDSLSHFVHIVKDQIQERELILRFINALKSIGLTPIMTAEKEPNENGIGFDEYMADCVLLLSSQASKDKTFPMRLIEIRKTRGHNHIRGKHPYKITSSGVEVFPHTLPAKIEQETFEEFRIEKISSGIDGLDDLLEGGYVRGTSTIIAGMPGTFKTTAAMHFLLDGAKKDDKGLLLTFNENPQFIISTMEQKGINIKEYFFQHKIKIWQYFPKNFYMDELIYLIENEINENGIKRIVIDGINDIERSIEDSATYKDYLTSILSIFIENKITSIFTQKLDKFTSSAPLTDINYASMFDGVIYLGTVEIESTVHKVISVLKMRGGNYSGDLRKITCSKNGIAVSDKFIGLSGILAGTPHGQYKKTVEEIFQPLYFIRDFLEMLSIPGIDEEQRTQVSESLKTEMAKLVDKLKEHFDVKG